MVRRSIDNWPGHKDDIYNIIKSKYGQRYANIFLQYYSNRYDKYNRSFLDYHLAFWLLDDYQQCHKGTKWMAFVGVGGTGKTTLAKNVFYFLDPTFNLSRLSTDNMNFIKNIDSLSEMQATLMDEPDDDAAGQSRSGKLLRKIFGKARQANMFVGICATDLTDIPTYIYRKLTHIFFLPSLGKYMLFKNRPKHGSYVIQDIRRNYQQKGYKVFYELSKDVGCLKGKTIGSTPLSNSEELQYIVNKKQDFKNDIKKFINQTEDSPKQQLKHTRDTIIMAMKRKGMSDYKISELTGLSRPLVQLINGKNKEIPKDSAIANS